MKAHFKPAATASRERDLKFVRRVYRLRILGLGLGAVSVASVLKLHNASIGWWILLLAHGFAWPHVAAALARHSVEPRGAEHLHLMVDSTLGGVWIAAMQFNLLPSVLLVTMLSVDKLSVGGPTLLARTSMLLLAACVLTWAALGFAVDLASPMSVVVACMPFLIAYPIAISSVTYVLATKLARQNRRLDELGRTDGLTRLANRREGFAQADKELARLRRSSRPAVLVLLDIDHFKDINDRYGHPAGDEVLCAVAETLRGCCRGVDVVARYGGDEFLLVLPDTDLRGAEAVARRIRRQLESRDFDAGPDLRCTVSVGAAQAGRDTASVDVWMLEADAALYRAKAAGRDRFVAGAAEAC